MAEERHKTKFVTKYLNKKVLLCRGILFSCGWIKNVGGVAHKYCRNCDWMGRWWPPRGAKEEENPGTTRSAAEWNSLFGCLSFRATVVAVADFLSSTLTRLSSIKARSSYNMLARGWIGHSLIWVKGYRAVTGVYVGNIWGKVIGSHASCCIMQITFNVDLM